MKYLITGSTGFIGKALLELLLSKGQAVACLVRADSNIKKIERNSNLKLFEYSNLLDDNLISEITKWQPEVFYHIGWKGVIGKERNEIFQFVDNINLTLQSVQLAAKVGCKKWIGAGSQAEYGVCNEMVIDEGMSCKPNTAYGKAKLASSIVALGMCELLNIQGVWGRIFSTYGPDDYDGYFIPYVINSLKVKSPLELTKCEQVWDYLYVTDAAEAFLALAEFDCYGIYNIGRGESVILKNVVEEIKLILNNDAEIGYGKIPYSSNQVMKLNPSVSKLKTDTNWEPKVSLHEGLVNTINFFLKMEV